jgi:hypothetical protein
VKKVEFKSIKPSSKEGTRIFSIDSQSKGLDWVLDRLNHFRASLGSRFWPHFLLKQYVAAGYLGKKAKKGFFEY